MTYARLSAGFLVVILASVSCCGQQVVFQGEPDAVRDRNCSMQPGNILICRDAPFTECPKDKLVSVNGALDGSIAGGNDYRQLITTIRSCSDSKTAVLAASATRSTGTVTATWGTNNFSAIREQYARTGAATFLIPSGSYLVKTDLDTTGQKTWLIASNSEVVISHGATVYWVGPSGATAGDYGNQFMLVGPGFGNIHIQIDGHVIGDNTGTSAGPGSPYLNQSAVIFVYPEAGNLAHDIMIDGSGSLENLYGFDVHAFGNNINFRNLSVLISAKGTNINSDNSDQSGLYLYQSFGMESAANGVHIHDNRFDSSGGVSLGGNSGSCYGDVVKANSFVHMTNTNVTISDCPVGAVIQGNTFYVGPGHYDSAVQIHDGPFSYVAALLVANNTIICDGGFAGIYTSGVNTRGSTFADNIMFTPDGAAACTYGILDETQGGVDAVQGGRYLGTLQDILLNNPNTYVRARNVVLVNGTNSAGSGTFDPKSTFISGKD